MSHTSFRNDPSTIKEILLPGNVNTDVVFANAVYSSGYIFGNIAFTTGGAQAGIPATVRADIQGNLTATGNVSTTGNISALYFLGNGSLLTGVSATLPTTVIADTRGNIIGNYANVNNVSAVFGNVANVLFNDGQVSMSSLVVSGGTYMKGAVGINVPSPGVQFAVSGTTQITGNFSTFGNLRCTQDTNLQNVFATRLRLKNVTNGGIAENIFRIEANVKGDNSFNFISASQGHGDPANTSVVFQVNGAGDVSANSITVKNITTDTIYSTYFSGSGSGLVNIPATAFTSGALYKDIAGSIEGNFANVAEVNATNVNANGISATGNISGSYFIGNGSQLVGVSATLPTTMIADTRGNLIGNYANVNNVSAVFGNVGNILFNNGQVSTGSLVVSGDTYMKGAVGINVASPGVQFAVSGTTQITGSFSTFGNLRCTQDTNLQNVFATRLRLKNVTNGGIAENIFRIEANVRGDNSFNFISASQNHGDPANTAVVFQVNGAGDISANSIATSGIVNGNILYLNAPTNTINMIQLGGTQATPASTNVFGLGRNSAAMRLNTSSIGTFEFYAGGVPIANITTAGNLNISGADATKAAGTTWLTGSDRRLKSNITPANLDTCLNVVRTLDLKRFEWGPQVAPLVRDTSVLGWIAQEVETLFPKSVKTTPAYGLQDAKMLDADQLFINTYGALKRAVEIIDDLTKTVDTLTTKVNDLTVKVNNITG